MAKSHGQISSELESRKTKYLFHLYAENHCGSVKGI
jgi:hypothetical protein